MNEPTKMGTMRKAQDGALLFSELADDATLRSNLFKGVVQGRDAVTRMIDMIDSLCPRQNLIYRHRVGHRDFILTEAKLLSGDEVEISTVGIRDDSGWISAVMLDHSPPAVAAKLAKRLEHLRAHSE